MTDPALPTIKEELERKALDILVETMDRYTRGAIDRRTAHVTVGTVWSLTAGLIDEGVLNMAAAAAEDTKTNAIKRYFVGKGSVLLLAFSTHSPGYVLLKFDTTTLARTKVLDRPTDVGEREAEMKKMADGFIASGYLEL